MSLDKLRKRLSTVDRELISLIARRQKIVAEIGVHKISTGTATRDYARERDVLEATQKQAQALGLEQEVAEQIMRALIRSSLTHQERTRVAAENSGAGKACLLYTSPSPRD